MRRLRSAIGAACLAAATATGPVVLAGGGAGVGALAVAGTAAAHDYHVTLAEAEYNHETSRLEVALRVRLSDLERALRARRPEEGRPADAAELDRRVAAYLAERWTFVDAAADTQAVEWVGAEYETSDGWLYFEVPLPGGLDGVMVENRTFFELEPTQLNTVTFRDGDSAFSESFSASEPMHRLAIKEAKEASAPPSPPGGG